MFRKGAVKRSISKVSSSNDDYSPGAKVYVVKIITNENGEHQFTSDDGSVSEVVELHGESSDIESDQIIELQTVTEDGELIICNEVDQTLSNDRTELVICEEVNQPILEDEAHVIVYESVSEQVSDDGSQFVLYEEVNQMVPDVEREGIECDVTNKFEQGGTYTFEDISEEISQSESGSEPNTVTVRCEDIYQPECDDRAEVRQGEICQSVSKDKNLIEPEEVNNCVNYNESDVMENSEVEQYTNDDETDIIECREGNSSESNDGTKIIECIEINKSLLDRNSSNTVSKECNKGTTKIGKAPKPVKERKIGFSGWIANRLKLKFQEKWFQEFPFIDYDKSNNLMFCKACRKYVNDFRKTSPFVIGTDNFRVSMLKYHERSSMHRECQDLADTLTSQDSEAMQKDLYKDQLSHVFKSVYFIFKNKMPYTHYPQLCESQKREGTDFTVYSTHLKVVPLFGKFIGMAFEKELGQKICDVREFSLVIDASFKRNIESHDLVYIKYLDNFIVQTVFLGVVDSSAKLHDSMYNILTNLFKKYSIDKWVDKVTFIMTDKSDTHLWLEGLMNLIKTMSPINFFSEVKYLTHKVKFCAKVVQRHKATCTFDALLWSIYCYYEKVDRGKKNLIHMNKELDEIVECYGSLPKNSYTTLYYEALKAVEQDYGSLVSLLVSEQLLMHFDFKTRKSGARILSIITRRSFVYKLALFIDIFACLSDFAEKLGSEDLLPFDVHMLLDEVCTGIEKAANGEGTNIAEIDAELSATPLYFRGVEVTDDSNIHHSLPEVKVFSEDLIGYLKSLVDNSLLEKSFIFNVCLWPEEDEISEFGNCEFQEIFLAFNGKEKHVDPALAEWKLFKSKVLKLFPFEVRQNSKSVIMKMVVEYELEFPFVSSILRKILLLNFESSEIKRGYHEMCLNKSFSRSMLSLQSLQTAMMISMYGPSLNEFDFSLAMDLFLNSRHRKFRKKIINKKLTEYSSDQEDDSLEERNICQLQVDSL